MAAPVQNEALVRRPAFLRRMLIGIGMGATASGLIFAPRRPYGAGACRQDQSPACPRQQKVMVGTVNASREYFVFQELFEQLTAGSGAVKIDCEVAAFADEKRQSSKQAAALGSA
jgi:hypothetical protein